jgi:hypothetical protein
MATSKPPRQSELARPLNRSIAFPDQGNCLII